MAHYYADIKAAIVSFIQTSTKYRNVYDYEEVKPAGYPAISVTPLQGSAEFLDTLRNRREFQFTIRCYQERIQVGASAAESILTGLVDELIAIFEASGSFTLNNTVVMATPVAVRWGYTQSPEADVRTAEITLIAVAAQ